MSEKSEAQPHTPFEGHLEPLETEHVVYGKLQTESSANLRTLTSSPDKIVRQERRHFTDAKKESEYLIQQQQMLLALEKYGIRIPKFDAVIGRNEKDEDKVFLVVQKIEGVDLDKIHLTGEYPPGLDESLASLLSYRIDALRNLHAFHSDLGVHQFRYGHGYGKPDQSNAYYLVDVDTGLFVDPSDPDYYRSFLEGANDFIREIKTLKEGNPKWNFSATKKKADELMVLWKNTINGLGERQEKFFMPSDTLLKRLVKMRDLYSDADMKGEQAGAYVKDHDWVYQARKFLLWAVINKQLTNPEIVSEFKQDWESVMETYNKLENPDMEQENIEKMKRFLDKIINQLQ